MAETCYSCQIFDVFNQKTLQFCQAFFEAVTPELKSLLAYLFMLWIIYRLCKSLIGREQNIQGLIKEFIDLSIATALLQSFQYWSGICFWIYNFGMELGIRILQITSEGQAVLKTTSGTEALLTYVEAAFTPVLDKIGVMMSDVSWTSLKLAIAIIPVAVIYFLLLWRIFASLFNVFVQLFAITLLAPVLCAFYALPPFQRASYTAIRILLTNSLQIVLSCGTIGIILFYFYLKVSKYLGGVFLPTYLNSLLFTKRITKGMSIFNSKNDRFKRLLIDRRLVQKLKTRFYLFLSVSSVCSTDLFRS